MKIESVEIHRLTLPFVTPFRTSFGEAAHRDVALVRVRTDRGEGWGECAAVHLPMYSSEYTAVAVHVMAEVLAPALLAGAVTSAADVDNVLGWVRGHRMAKSAVEAAVLDAELRGAGLSFAQYLGGVRARVPAGVSVGIMGSLPELVDAVRGFVAEGYRRIKLKIKPGWDVEPVRAVREGLGDDLILQVDANAAYSMADLARLAQLDDFGLAMIEQPFAEDDLLGHAQLAARTRTPICLDESITSARVAATAINMGACQVVNIKAGRVGGYLEARRIHDVCAAAGVPVWCGGMMETGVGRAANLALASLPNFLLPGDTSATERYYRQDITAPFDLQDGFVQVPTGPGTGVLVDMDVLASLRTDLREVRA